MNKDVVVSFAYSERRCFSRACQRQHDLILLPYFVTPTCSAAICKYANARKPMLRKNEVFVTQKLPIYNFQFLSAR